MGTRWNYVERPTHNGELRLAVCAAVGGTGVWNLSERRLRVSAAAVRWYLATPSTPSELESWRIEGIRLGERGEIQYGLELERNLNGTWMEPMKKPMNPLVPIVLLVVQWRYHIAIAAVGIAALVWML